MDGERITYTCLRIGRLFYDADFRSGMVTCIWLKDGTN